MSISDRELQELVAAGIVDDSTARRILDYYQEGSHGRARFDLSHTAYYLGALVVMSAMGWFMSEAWSRYGGPVLTVVAIAYALVFILAGESLWRRSGFRQPGGLLFTLAVWMTPLAVFGVQHALNLWPEGEFGMYRDYLVTPGTWIALEVATIVAALLAIRLRPFAFLAFPLAFGLYFLSLDVGPFILGASEIWTSYEVRRSITLLFGGVLLAVTYTFDGRTREDYAFWLYLSGLVAFWGALTAEEIGQIVYLVVNVALILFAVLLRRKTFLVFGGLGLFIYLAYLASEVFAESLLFPVALTAIGIAIIAAGVWYRRHQSRIETTLLAVLPAAVRETLPRYRAPPPAGGAPKPSVQ
jgi:hypothetical protein